MSSREATASASGGERAELRERCLAWLRQTSTARNEFMLADFAEQERDRAWNEALGEANYAAWNAADVMGVSADARKHIIRCICERKRPQPPAQQDDKPETAPSMRTALTTAPAPTGSAPSCEGIPPTQSGQVAAERSCGQSPVHAAAVSGPFDIERRARELFKPHPYSLYGLATNLAIQLAREAVAAKAEEIAKEIEAEEYGHYGIGTDERRAAWRGAQRDFANIARSHARPPKPAPETREAKLERALREIAEHGETDWEVERIARRALETKP